MSSEQIDITLNNIENWVTAHPDTFLTFSGGKDSTVLLHLLKEVVDQPRIAFFDTGFLYRQTYDFIKFIEQAWNLEITYITTQPSPLEVFKKSGYWEHGVPKKTMDMKRVLIDNYLEAAQEHFQTTDSLYGVRAEESKARRIILHKNQGLVERKGKDGSIKDRSYAPIWNWSGKDVNRYIVQNKLPLNAAYKRLRELGVPPAKRRTGVVLSDGIHLGDWALNYQIDPGLGKMIESHFPMLQEYR